MDTGHHIQEENSSFWLQGELSLWQVWYFCTTLSREGVGWGGGVWMTKSQSGKSDPTNLQQWKRSLSIEKPQPANYIFLNKQCGGKSNRPHHLQSLRQTFKVLSAEGEGEHPACIHDVAGG